MKLAPRAGRLAAEIVPRLLLVAFYGYFGVKFAAQGTAGFPAAVKQGWLSDEALQLYPVLGKSAFMLIIAGLAVVRRPRIAGDARLYAQTIAFAGTFFLVLLPWVATRAVLPEPIAIASSMLMLIGSVASALVVSRLGQSFSIMPEARRLVTGGPYRFVRHPLYLAEEFMMLGVFLQYPLGWTLVMTACHGVLQIERMRLEERVLADTFPDYADYAARTARLLPGIY